MEHFDNYGKLAFEIEDNLALYYANIHKTRIEVWLAVDLLIGIRGWFLGNKKFSELQIGN